MGDVKDDVASLFPSIVQPVSEVKSADVLDLSNSSAQTAVDTVAQIEEAVVSEFKQIHDRLHEELAVFARGRTEDNIGLNDPYWAKLNELRMHIHNNK